MLQQAPISPPANWSGTTAEKEIALEGLRGVACLAVMISHSIGTVFPYIGHWGSREQGLIPQKYFWEEIVASPFPFVFINGSFAVAIFFVLSGYVLTKRYYETGSRETLSFAAAKRFPRLMIPALAAIFIAWVMLQAGLMQTTRLPDIGGAGWPMFFYSETVPIWTVFYETFVGGLFSGNYFLNSPLWSIRVELWASFILFASYLMLGKRNLVLTSILFVCLALFVFNREGNIWMVCGMMIGSLLNHFRASLDGKPLIGAALVVLGLVIGAFDYSPAYAPLWSISIPSPPYPLPDMNVSMMKLMQAIGAVLLVTGIMAWPGALRVLGSSAPKFLGKISFPAYLLHWPICCSVFYGLMRRLAFENALIKSVGG